MAPTKVTTAADAIHAVVFDAYGTLFDVHSVVRRCEALFPGKGAALSQLWRTKQLEYTWLRSLMGRYEDFGAVTRSALRFACGALGSTLSHDAEQSLLDEYLHLAPYPEVPAALEALAGRKLAILSNGSPATLTPLVANTGLAQRFHSVISVDSLRVFKPHPSVYQLAVDRLGVAREAIAFISSNFWDVCGATSFGFRTYWINRAGAQADELGFTPAAVLTRLDELPAALQKSGVS
jgi:2-haloacid dehalogenase